VASNAETIMVRPAALPVKCARPADTFGAARRCRTNCFCGSLFPMEYSFTCPYCGEEISMVLDLSASQQRYVEDCEVCCKPIELSFLVQEGEPAEFSARTLDE
jgi:hypothetical protein